MIDRLAIVGIGLIGGSIGLTAKVRGIATQVVGIEPDARTWVDALRLGAVDEITNDLAAGVGGADMVVLAAPVGAIIELLPRLRHLLAPGAVVTDAGSVKGAITKVGTALLGPQFVPGHPMAGSERGGVSGARADLFRGATWAITPTEATDVEAVERVAAFATSLGATPLIISSEVHDKAVALTSHLPHVLAYTLASIAAQQSAQDAPHLLRLAAGSWASATRVAASSSDLWTDIAMQNAVPLAQTLHDFATELTAVAEALSANDRQTVHEHFTAGHVAKHQELDLKSSDQ